MSQAVIASIALTPTHDGDTAMVVELRFPDGGRSQVQVDPSSVDKVLAKAGVASAPDLIGLPWSVVQVREPVFFSHAGAVAGSWSNVASKPSDS